jgi:hypothetical protein
MPRPPMILLIALVTLGLSTASNPADEAFEKADVGSLPAGWSSAKTGAGPGSVWMVQEDATAPSGRRVLTQTSSEGPRPLFNLCVSS